MDEHNRVKREPPERIEPKRQWTGDFVPPEAHASTDGRASDPRDAAYQTINDAYRVIDDYMRQGQQMAENLWMPLGGTSAPFREAPERFMRALGDMTMAWVEVMQQWTANSQGGGVPAATGTAGPFSGVDAAAESAVVSPTSDTGVSHVAPLRVSVLAKGTFELVVDLSDRMNVAQLGLTELRESSIGAAPLTDVGVHKDANGSFVRIVVPDDQAVGTYNGLFVDQATRRPRGTLSLTLLSRG
jgi:hypothetical protein